MVPLSIVLAKSGLFSWERSSLQSFGPDATRHLRQVFLAELPGLVGLARY